MIGRGHLELGSNSCKDFLPKVTKENLVSVICDCFRNAMMFDDMLDEEFDHRTCRIGIGLAAKMAILRRLTTTMMIKSPLTGSRSMMKSKLMST